MRNLRNLIPDLKRQSVLQIVLLVWFVFATLYVFYGEYNRLGTFVSQQAYNSGIQEAYTKGITDSVVQLMQEAQKCQPIPVTAGDQQVNLISLECLKPPVDAETTE